MRFGCQKEVIFNIYHQAMMRQAESNRMEENKNAGVKWRWIPGGSFAGIASWEKGCSEAKGVRLTSTLFADDTTIVGMKGEMNEGTEVVKRVMNKW